MLYLVILIIASFLVMRFPHLEPYSPPERRLGTQPQDSRFEPSWEAWLPLGISASRSAMRWSC